MDASGRFSVRHGSEKPVPVAQVPTKQGSISQSHNVRLGSGSSGQERQPQAMQQTKPASEKSLHAAPVKSQQRLKDQAPRRDHAHGHAVHRIPQ